MLAVVTMLWLGELRGFVAEAEAFFKNGEPVTATQRAFRTQFGLWANESATDRKMILLWIQRVRATRSARKRKPLGCPKNVRTPTNFCTRFGLRANESVPERNTILLRVQRVRATGYASESDGKLPRMAPNVYQQSRPLFGQYSF